MDSDADGDVDRGRSDGFEMLSHTLLPYILGETSAPHFIDEKIERRKHHTSSTSTDAPDDLDCQVSMVTTVMMTEPVMWLSDW